MTRVSRAARELHLLPFVCYARLCLRGFLSAGVLFSSSLNSNARATPRPQSDTNDILSPTIPQNPGSRRLSPRALQISDCTQKTSTHKHQSNDVCHSRTRLPHRSPVIVYSRAPHKNHKFSPDQITGGTFAGNQADFGGFLYKQGAGNATCTGGGTTPAIGNRGVFGGAIYAVKGASLELSCDLVENEAQIGPAM